MIKWFFWEWEQKNVSWFQMNIKIQHADAFDSEIKLTELYAENEEVGSKHTSNIRIFWQHKKQSN